MCNGEGSRAFEAIRQLRGLDDDVELGPFVIRVSLAVLKADTRSIRLP